MIYENTCLIVASIRALRNWEFCGGSEPTIVGLVEGADFRSFARGGPHACRFATNKWLVDAPSVSGCARFNQRAFFCCTRVGGPV